MKTRTIYTKVWEKNHFAAKNKDAKLLFMYLITNSRIGFTGAYEITDRIIIFDTGLTAKELEAAKKILFPKVLFFEGWVFVKNAQKYSNFNSPKLDKPKKEEMDALPEHIKKCFFEGVCDLPQEVPAVVEETQVAVVETMVWDDMDTDKQMQAFLNNDECVFGKDGNTFVKPVQEIVCQWLMGHWKVSQQEAKHQMEKFIVYWTAPNKKKTKQFWQTKPTFEVKRRFVTWMDNNFGKSTASVNSNKYQVEGL